MLIKICQYYLLSLPRFMIEPYTSNLHVEQVTRKVLQTRVASDRHDRVSGTELSCNRNGAHDVQPTGDARKNTFLCG